MVATTLMTSPASKESLSPFEIVSVSTVSATKAPPATLFILEATVVPPTEITNPKLAVSLADWAVQVSLISVIFNGAPATT